MGYKPGHTVLGHIVLCVLDIGQYELVLILKIVEKLRVGHSRLRGDISERNPVNRLILYAALEGHQDFQAHFFFINNNRHVNIVA